MICWWPFNAAIWSGVIFPNAVALCKLRSWFKNHRMTLRCPLLAAKWMGCIDEVTLSMEFCWSQLNTSECPALAATCIKLISSIFICGLLPDPAGVPIRDLKVGPLVPSFLAKSWIYFLPPKLESLYIITMQSPILNDVVVTSHPLEKNKRLSYQSGCQVVRDCFSFCVGHFRSSFRLRQRHRLQREE